MNQNEIIFFLVFLAVIIFILIIDLGVFNKKSKEVNFKQALGWTALWVSLSVGFYFFLRYYGDLLHGVSTMEDIQRCVDRCGHQIDLTGLSFEAAKEIYLKNLSLEYITGYIIEYALSMDNIFVIIMIFVSFGVDRQYYHKILFWGIFGAIVMRFLFIFLASTLIYQFHWVLYLFGAILIFTGIKLFATRNQREEIDTNTHPIVVLAGKIFKVAKDYRGGKFFIKKDGIRYVTPMFVVLLVIEFSDVIFAVDSVPAIFSITNDPYIVFFSNIFAIIGLRSLFFVLTNLMRYFQYLNIGLSILLIFIGFKLIFNHWLHEIGFETVHSLYVVGGILAISMIFSVLLPKKN